MNIGDLIAVAIGGIVVFLTGRLVWKRIVDRIKNGSAADGAGVLPLGIIELAGLGIGVLIAPGANWHVIGSFLLVALATSAVASFLCPFSGAKLTIGTAANICVFISGMYLWQASHGQFITG